MGSHWPFKHWRFSQTQVLKKGEHRTFISGGNSMFPLVTPFPICSAVMISSWHGWRSMRSMKKWAAFCQQSSLSMKRIPPIRTLSIIVFATLPALASFKLSICCCWRVKIPVIISNLKPCRSIEWHIPSNLFCRKSTFSPWSCTSVFPSLSFLISSCTLLREFLSPEACVISDSMSEILRARASRPLPSS